MKNIPRTWFVYIVECADHTLYTGCTPDIQKRVETHNAGKGAKYTRVRLPVRLIYQEKYSTKSEACRREAQIKQLTRSQKQLLVASQ